MILDAFEERLHKRSPNYAVSLGAEMDPRIGELWMQFRNGPVNEKEALKLRDLAIEAGVLIEGRKRLAEQAWRARKALQALTPSPDREALDQLAAGIAK